MHTIRNAPQGTAEHVVLQLDAFVDRDIVLDLDVVADPCSGHHDDILAEVAPLADDRARHHGGKVPDLGSAADRGPVVDVTGLVGDVPYTPMISHSSSKSTPASVATVSRMMSITFSTSLAVAFPVLMM